MITTAQAIKKYGKPTQDGNYLVTINLPYPMRLAWDKKTKVTKMRCNGLVAANFTNVFHEILQVYGLEKIQELGIDLFGGCFNFRAMRGGSDYSRHSWGIAIDRLWAFLSVLHVFHCFGALMFLKSLYLI